MNGKELTIFEGMPSIHLNNNNQMQIEEEEAIEDQKRRRAELQLELEKEFGNMSVFEDDDETNQTSNSTYYNHQNHRDFPLRDDFSDLRNLVETKSREIVEISNLLAKERKQHKAAIEELEKRLAISEAEKERALMNRNQSQELLVETKTEVISIKDENQKLMSKIKFLENENGNLVGEIESTKTMLSDIQTKYNMVEKNVMFNANRSTDKILKDAHERHSAQIAKMQQEIERLKTKYDDLNHEHNHLTIRYQELQKSREAMLIEKSEIINQLNRNLEDAQRQCQDLLAREDLTQENMRLKTAIQTIEQQKEELSLSNSKLKRKIQEKTSEIEIMDTVINECSGNNQSFAEITNFVNRDPLQNKNINNSTPLSAEMRYPKIVDELCKSQNNVRMKREEIKILEKQLAEKDSEINEMKKDENKLLVDLNKYKDEVYRLESKVSILQEELEKALDNSKQCESINNMERDLNAKKQECEELVAMIDKLKLNEIEINRILEDKEEKLEAISNDLNEIRKKNDENKACEECEKYIAKIEELEISYLQSQNSNVEYLTELNKLKQELIDARKTLDELEGKLSLQNLRDKEIEKLHEKAREFEEFMRSSSNHAGDSLPSGSKESSSNTFQTKTSYSPESSERLNAETNIRDEMARIFANQIKTLEKRFVEETKKLQNENIVLNNELDERCRDLEVASEQLELLKFTIVNEREEFQVILKQRDDGFKEKIEKYQQHIATLNEQIDMIDSERELIESLKRQLDDERELLSKKEEATVQKLKKLQQESTKIIEELNEKYKTAKKTASNYKKYSEDKEKHYRSECERIKNGYAEAVEKIQSRLKDTLQEKEDSYQEKLKRIEQEYEFKIDVLKGMLEKSQKQ